MLMKRLAAGCFLALTLAGAGFAAIGQRPFFAAPPPLLTTTQYYVAAAGSDGANCLSPGTACQTIPHMNGLTYTGTVVINFNGGDSFSGTINPTSIAGITGITLQSYGTGQATIAAGTGNGIVFLNHGGITVNNLAVVGSGGVANVGISITNSQPGNTKLQNIIISNSSVSGFGSNGIQVAGTLGWSGFNNVLISDNLVNGNTIADNTGLVGTDGGSTAGIYVWSFNAVSDPNGLAGYGLGQTTPAHTNVVVTGNTVTNNTGVAGASDWTGDGVVVAECGNCTATLNIVHTNGAKSDYPAGPGNMENLDNISCTLSFNEAYLSLTVMDDGDGITIDGGNANCVMEYNYTHQSFAAGILMASFADGYITSNSWNNNTARYNISENDAANNNQYGSMTFSPSPVSSIESQSTLNNLRVYNNTTWGLNSQALNVQTSGVTGVTANNVFATALKAVNANANPSLLALESNNYFAINLVFAASWNGINYSSFSAFQSGSGQETTPLSNPTGSPFLFNLGSTTTCGGYSTTCPTAYQLTPASPLVGAGINLTMAPYSLSVGTQDYYGNAIPRSGSYNVGAYGGAGATPAGTSPIVVALTPYSGAAGTLVTISGFNFSGATAIKFGATNATSFSCGSTNVCTATAPAATAGSEFVTVTTGVGTSANVIAGAFVYPATQYYFDTAGTDTPGGNGCKAGTGTAACSTITQFNSITYTGAIVANFNGSFTDSCPAVDGNANFSGATSVVLNGNGTTTITANAADSVHCAPPANFGTQAGGALFIQNILTTQFVTATGFTFRGNGGNTEYGILIYSTANNVTISNNDVQGFWCDSSLAPNMGCFFGSDIANRSAGENITIIDNFVHGSVATSKDDNGIECNNCNTNAFMISGNTVTNIGGGPTPTNLIDVG